MVSKLRLVFLTAVGLAVAGLFLPQEAAAQRRGVYRSVHVGVGFGAPFYYPRYYSPFFSYYDPFWTWSGFGYWQYPPYPYYGRIYDPTGAARLKITPKQTQVFVDGYFVGLADEFDGALQRLRVDAGEHELEFYLEGHRTARQPVLFRRDGTITIKHVMEPLGPGETSEKPSPSQPQAAGQRGPQNPAGPPAVYRGRAGQRRPPQDRGGQQDDFGTLAMRVQPADAEILIDGERWDGADAESRLSVQLADGPHRVEIRREGYRPYTANVRIRRGQTETLNVSLTK